MKKLLLISILLFNLTPTFSQRMVISGFKPLPQLRSKWCWAACAQMIQNYNESYKISTSKSQCEIVNNFIQDLIRARKINRINYNCCDKNSFCIDKLDPKLGNIDNDFNDFHSIFRSLGYTYKERYSHNIIHWDDLKYLISKNSPAILGSLNYDGIYKDGVFSHDVVVSGLYYGKSKLIRISDPWEMCKGCEYYISYDLLACNDNSSNDCNKLSKNLHFAYDFVKIGKPELIKASELKPLREDECDLIGNESAKELVHDFIKQLLVEDDQNFLKEIGLTGISDNDLIDAKPTKIHQISKSKLQKLQISKSKSQKSNIDSLTIDSVSYDDLKYVYNIKNSSNNQQISVIVIKKRGCPFFYIQSISNCSLFKNKLPDDNLFNDTAIPSTSYSIVSCYPFQNTFYEISHQSKKYLIPFIDYPEMNLFKNTKYPEVQVLNLLKNKIFN